MGGKGGGKGGGSSGKGSGGSGSTVKCGGSGAKGGTGGSTGVRKSGGGAHGRGLMKAPGAEGYISRSWFEGNPKGYFQWLHYGVYDSDKTRPCQWFHHGGSD